MMREAPYSLLLETASRDNVLTLTTACSTNCIFCSHNQNPDGIEAFYIKNIDLNQADEIISLLDKKKKVIIGESTTRICEGEPFIHKNIIEILTKIRHAMPSTIIQITTSAVPLTGNMIDEIVNIGGIELNISINSTSVEGRKLLYKGNAHMSAIEALTTAAEKKIPISGSVVALPDLVGWPDIRKSVLFLSDIGAKSVRIFAPGYTKYSKAIKENKNIEKQLFQFAKELRKETSMPIIVEPALIKDLSAEIIGVVKDSSGYIAGIQTADIVVSVNKQIVFSRADAFYKIHDGANPEVELVRNGEKLFINLQKQQKQSSGLVFDFDIMPETILDIEKAIKRTRKKDNLLLTSERGFEILSLCEFDGEYLTIEKVINTFFGGNIACSGLLTLHDIYSHLDNRENLPESLILPAIMFDAKGRDLTGRYYTEIEEKYSIKVIVV